MAKHRCDMPSVCDLLRECGFPIAQKVYKENSKRSGEPIHAPMKGQFQYDGHAPQSGCWNNTEANLSTHERRQYAQGDITMTGALYIVLSN